MAENGRGPTGSLLTDGAGNQKLLSAATAASSKGTLGVAIAPIDAAGNALLALLPS